MNRRSFLHAAAAGVPGLLLCRSLSAAPEVSNPAISPFMVRGGGDRRGAPISLYEGDTFFTKVSGRDSNGGLYIDESTRLRRGGPAQHVHHAQDEWFSVIDGEFVIKVGDTTYEAKAGDSVFGPRGIPHVWAKVSEGPAKMLIVFQPAGAMEEYFRAVSEGRLARMTPAEQEEFRKRHGFERTGPALFHQKE